MPNTPTVSVTASMRRHIAQHAIRRAFTYDGATTTAAESPPLTLQTIRDAVEQLQAAWPVIYCAPNENIEPGVIYKIADELAMAGYALACHPDTVPAVRDELFRSQVRLCHVADMDESETKRRAMLVAKKMFAQPAFTYSPVA